MPVCPIYQDWLLIVLLCGCVALVLGIERPPALYQSQTCCSAGACWYISMAAERYRDLHDQKSGAVDLWLSMNLVLVQMHNIRS